MSRTVRHLPTNGKSREKWYIPNIVPTRRVDPKCHRLWYISEGSIIRGKDIQNYTGYEENIIKEFEIPPKDYSKSYQNRYKVIKGFWHITTEQDVARQLQTDILYYCKKNKTCRRQRKNAVRLEKKCRRSKERAKHKINTMKFLEEFYISYD